MSDTRVEFLLDKNILTAVEIVFDYVTKITHNLWVISLRSHRDDERERSDRETYVRAELVFYRKIGKEFFCSPPGADVEENGISTLCHPLSHMYFFAFCIAIGGDALQKYLGDTAGKEYMHYYNAYARIVKQGSPRVMQKLNTVGEYLCKTVDELKTQIMIYHSIFYESAALEYAYKNKLYDVAGKILGCGYDHYRELDTLHLVYRYEKDRFYREVKDLKKLCLERGIALMGENYFYEHRYIRDLYGDDFCDEFLKEAEDALESLKSAGSDDPRLKNNRNTPDWAV